MSQALHHHLGAPPARATSLRLTFGVLNTSSNVGRIGFNRSAITGPNFVMSASFDLIGEDGGDPAATELRVEGVAFIRDDGSDRRRRRPSA
jgi:hypothetical protein